VCLRERKAGKEKRRQQAREKEQQQAIEEEAGAGAMEAPPPAEAMDDDKSMAVFLEWSDVLGYDNLERFRTADDDDYACLPLSSEQLGRVLLLLEERDPAAWLISEEGESAAETAPVASPSAADAGNDAALPVMPPAVDDDANGEEVCIICYDEPVSVMLVHANDTSHECVCVTCADLLKARGDPCPVCRAPIFARVKTNFKASQVLHGAAT
jgi:hypothetical protein